MAMEGGRLTVQAISVPEGYSQITSLSSATSIRARNGRFALIQVLNQNVRWRDDGVDPTPTVGMRIHAGTTLTYYGDIRSIRLIEEASGAEVNVSVYA